MRKERKLKAIGLIGAGGFALNHLQLLVRGGSSHGLQLVAVADPTELKVTTAALLAEHGIRHYPDYEQMFDREALDGVFIATPIPTHYAMTESALRRGLRVYLEKPPVTSLGQLDELIRLDANQLVQVGFNMNSWPAVRRTFARIRRGDFGAVGSVRVVGLWPRSTAYYSRAAWAGRMGSLPNLIFDGPATNAMSHYVQLLCTAADAAGGGALEEVRGEFYRARPIESYDTCSLSGRFAQGPRFSVVMSHAAGPESVMSLKIETERGVIHVDQSLLSRIGSSRLDNVLAHAHRDFGRLLHQELDRPRVTLSDCRCFLEIVSRGLADSGGIHTIPSGEISHEREGSEQLFVVRGLGAAAQRCAEGFLMFSEAGMPWRR